MAKWLHLYIIFIQSTSQCFTHTSMAASYHARCWLNYREQFAQRHIDMRTRGVGDLCTCVSVYVVLQRQTVSWTFFLLLRIVIKSTELIMVWGSLRRGKFLPPSCSAVASCPALRWRDDLASWHPQPDLKGREELEGRQEGGWGKLAFIMRACLHLSSAPTPTHQGQGLTTREHNALGHPAVRGTLQRQCLPTGSEVTGLSGPSPMLP